MTTTHRSTGCVWLNNLYQNVSTVILQPANSFLRRFLLSVMEIFAPLSARQPVVVIMLKSLLFRRNNAFFTKRRSSGWGHIGWSTLRGRVRRQIQIQVLNGRSARWTKVDL